MKALELKAKEAKSFKKINKSEHVVVNTKDKISLDMDKINKNEDVEEALKNDVIP